MFENLKRKVAQLKELQGVSSGMAAIDQVKLNIPDDAVYVTLVEMMVLPGSVQISKAEHKGMFVYDSIVGAEHAVPTMAYMLHNGQELMFIADQQRVFATPIAEILNLQSMSSLSISANRATRSGFICNLRDGRSILIRTPMPIATDATTTFNTVHGISDLTCGWKDELAPFGVEMLYSN